MKQVLIILLVIAAKQVAAQNDWTMQQCMQYAVEHNHEVKQAELKLDNYKAVPSITLDAPSTLKPMVILT